MKLNPDDYKAESSPVKSIIYTSMATFSPKKLDLNKDNSVQLIIQVEEDNNELNNSIKKDKKITHMREGSSMT